MEGMDQNSLPAGMGARRRTTRSPSPVTSFSEAGPRGQQCHCGPSQWWPQPVVA